MTLIYKCQQAQPRRTDQEHYNDEITNIYTLLRTWKVGVKIHCVQTKLI